MENYYFATGKTGEIYYIIQKSMKTLHTLVKTYQVYPIPTQSTEGRARLNGKWNIQRTGDQKPHRPFELSC